MCYSLGFTSNIIKIQETLNVSVNNKRKKNYVETIFTLVAFSRGRVCKLHREKGDLFKKKKKQYTYSTTSLLYTFLP